MQVGWAIRELDWPRDVAATAAALAGRAELAWLDSPDCDTPDARFSLICRTPVAVLSQMDGQPAELTLAGTRTAQTASGWQLWQQAVRKLPRWPPARWNLAPGWVGYVGFEMARELERLPCSHAADLGLPLLRVGLFDRGIVLDHEEHRAFAVVAAGLRAALGLPESGPEELCDGWQQALTAEPLPEAARQARLTSAPDRRQYENMVCRALEYIAAGDIYQVNLAQRLRFEGLTDALATYARLRRGNPAPYAALLRWANGAVASVSPELFLRLRGNIVRTCPIKGTRPRRHDVRLDAAARRELLASAKEAAELAMIVDVHRNDLGRVCQFGSVRVVDARRVEAHPTVFHTVAEITGRLRPDCDGLDLLAACFPAGSISGAPKIRALEIIDELEPTARGAYTGAIGMLALDGQMCLNVAIRTLQFRDTAATLYLGGGIVADSDPAAEYEETWAKGRGIMAALNVAAPTANGPAGTRPVATGGTRGN